MIKMQEENIMKMVRWSMGLTILVIYAITGTDGVLLLLGAFLLGMPLEKRLTPTQTTPLVIEE